MRLEPNQLSPKILLIDDNPLCNKILARFCSKWGYATIVAHDGRQALEALEQSEVALIISDINLTDINGFELSETIYKSNPETPLIFNSGLSKEEVKQNNSLNRPFIQKPYVPSDMYQTISKSLQGSLCESA